MEIKNVCLKVKKKFLEDLDSKLIAIYIMFNIILVTLGSFISIELFRKTVILSYILIGGLVLNIIALTIMILRNKYKKDKTQFVLLAIIFFTVISVIFSVNKDRAIFGTSGRYEGVIVILYYLSLFFLSSMVNIKYKKAIVITFLLTGIIQGVFAILQKYAVIDSEVIKNGVVVKVVIWATGFITNPNFYGTYSLLCLSYSIGLYLDEKKLVQRIIYAIFIAYFMIQLLISDATSVAIGLGAVFAFIVIYCLKNKNYKKLFVVSIILVCITIITAQLGKTTIVSDLLRTGGEATELAKGNAEDDFGSGRIYIWKNTVKIIPKYLWTGVGVDNFRNAFDGGALFSVSGKILFDKAHNEYLQLLVTQGIFSLISYLVLYAIVSYRGMKIAFMDKKVFLILPIIGHLVQAFFNISVIEVAPYFYIALGLCNERIRPIKEKRLYIDGE